MMTAIVDKINNRKASLSSGRDGLPLWKVNEPSYYEGEVKILGEGRRKLGDVQQVIASEVNVAERGAVAKIVEEKEAQRMKVNRAAQNCIRSWTQLSD